MVDGYISTDTSADDQHRHEDLTLVDDPQALYTEWARHATWRARGRLDRLLAEISFNPDSKQVAMTLEEAVKDVSQAIEEMRDDGEHHMHHYEQSSS